MRETLDHVQAEAEGRVGKLDGDAKDDTKVPAPDKTRKANLPPLQSVRLNASDADDSDAKEEAERPQLKVVGQPSFGKRKRGDGASSPNSMEPSGGPVPEPPSSGLGPDPDSVKFESQGTPGKGTRPSALDPAARKAYDHALALVHEKKYDSALEAFAGFLVKWPDHPYAANAHYWRGESYFAQGQYEKAEEQFAGLIATFPLGNKVPDALLKLSLTRTKLGKTAEAKAARDQLERDFPRTDAARRARGESTRKEKP